MLDVDADADTVKGTFELAEGVYLLGSLERGLTVYSQQARAHNLVWALKKSLGKKPRIAVIGGGIAGLTVGAAIAASAELPPRSDVDIYLLERRAHLCPFQLGCDTRWLHPRLYDWPMEGSRVRSAGLPVLDWQGNRASDVAHRVVTAFANGRESLKRAPFSGDPFRVFLEVEHVTIDLKTREVEWVGRTDAEQGATRRGQRLLFDVIILTAGFGVEQQSGHSSTPSYWRNESYGQPILNGRTHTYGISGYGDGALIDLARLTIDRFRQDRIIDELFGFDKTTDESLAHSIKELKEGESAYDLLTRLENSLLSGKIDLIRQRLRTDVKVGVYLGGRDHQNKSISQVFGGKVSFINKVLFYLLFRCGAFVPIFSRFDDWRSVNGVQPERLIVRHGPNTITHISALLSDPTDISARLTEIQLAQAQVPNMVFPINSFLPIFGDQYGPRIA